MKIKSILIVVLIGTILLGCSPYKRVALTGGQFYGRNIVIQSLDNYDIYVHEADSVYEMVDPVVTEDREIVGKRIPVPDKNKRDIKADDTTKIKLVNERDDLHIYLEEGKVGNAERSSDSLVVSEPEIESVIMAAKEKKGILGILLTLLLAFFIVIAIILVAAMAAVAASDSGSDSGGSDSGGSDSDSSCYVATMAYGSYEAPQVLVLRKFRDQFLQKFKAGRQFIQWYYANSPSFVEKHASKKWLHKIIRSMLNFVVLVLKPFLK